MSEARGCSADAAELARAATAKTGKRRAPISVFILQNFGKGDCGLDRANLSQRMTRLIYKLTKILTSLLFRRFIASLLANKRDLARSLPLLLSLSFPRLGVDRTTDKRRRTDLDRANVRPSCRRGRGRHSLPPSSLPSSVVVPITIYAIVVRFVLGVDNKQYLVAVAGPTSSPSYSFILVIPSSFVHSLPRS